MARSNRLFGPLDSFSVQGDRKERLQREIAAYNADKLLNTNVDDLVKYFAEKFAVEVPILLEEELSADHQESQRDVSGDPRRMAYHLGDGRPVYVTGTEITVELPFTGEPDLFHVQPSTYSTMPPEGVLHNNSIIFKIWGDNLQSQEVQSTIQRWITDVKQWLQWHTSTFSGFNAALEREARQAIEQRRAKLLRDQNLVAGLGIAIKRRSDAITTYAAPEVKRRLTPKMPPASVGPYTPEPVLEENEYQHILKILGGMVHVMERSPHAFHGIDEESLRTIFLVSLNGHYEGQATGETFNYEGKTDILIRSGDRNIFVAECKFWSGPAKLVETVDQLLGYLSWRDSKTAILLFNRNRDFSRVLAAIPDAMRTHPNFQKDEGKRGETQFRYVFRHKDDPAKVLHLTVLTFDVPQPTS
jgi:hypothetical protein